MLRRDNCKSTSNIPKVGERSLLDHFMEHDSVAAVLLLLAAALGLLCANTPLRTWYEHFWEYKAGIHIGPFLFSQDIHHWIDDGLMSIFFFMVGLEIKRELVAGELSSLRRATLPMVAAFGGMLFPALIYSIITHGTGAERGWGIPMATDIAFAAGCMSLMGKRVSKGLVVFLVALAIVDDLGSVLVIAIFYTDRIAIEPLFIGGVLIALSALLWRFGVRRTTPYVLIACLIWLAFLRSGVHATIAGVLLAFTIPSSPRYEAWRFYGRVKELLNQFREEEHRAPAPHSMISSMQQSLIHAVTQECVHVEAPLQRIERTLHHIVLFAIMPIFAFSNAGVSLEWAAIGDMLTKPVTLGVMLGLLLGKQVGIMLLSWLSVRAGIAELPTGVTWKHVYGLSWLAGIGFTMSLFIDSLAFAPQTGVDPQVAAEHLAQGKVGIFIASTIAGIVGIVILRHVSANSATQEA